MTPGATSAVRGVTVQTVHEHVALVILWKTKVFTPSRRERHEHQRLVRGASHRVSENYGCSRRTMRWIMAA